MILEHTHAFRVRVHLVLCLLNGPGDELRNSPPHRSTASEGRKEERKEGRNKERKKEGKEKREERRQKTDVSLSRRSAKILEEVSLPSNTRVYTLPVAVMDGHRDHGH
jgi:predicted transposase YdaD